MQRTTIFFKLTSLTIIITVIFKILQLVIRAYNVFVLQKIINGNELFRSKLKFIISEFKVENTIDYFVIISFLVSFSIWFYISYKNTNLISSRQLTYKPILALFSLIIPIFNLFAPYKIMNEIWTVRNRDLTKEKEGKDLINMWWFLSIALFIYSRYCKYKFTHADNIQDILKAEYLSVLLFLVGIHYFITLLKLIPQIQKQSKPQPTSSYTKSGRTEVS